MIEASTARTPGFIARLVRRAEAIALAHGETRQREKRSDPSRWRRAALLWPLFNRDI